MSHLFTPLEHGVLHAVVGGEGRQVGVGWIAHAGVEPYYDLATENLDMDALAERTLKTLQRRGLVYQTHGEFQKVWWWATDFGVRVYQSTYPDAYSESLRSRIDYGWYWLHTWPRLSYLEWCWQRWANLMRAGQLAHLWPCAYTPHRSSTETHVKR